LNTHSTFDAGFAEENKIANGMLLASLLKPKSFDELLGQKELFSHDAVLRRIITAGNFDSLIFVGPSGTGKTTVAQLTGKYLSMPFMSLHSTTAGAADLKKLSDAAGFGAALVFIDEIHRYNKTQQNLLLKLVDDRLIKIIGASTENPIYSLIPAFRSRSLIFNFKSLERDDFLILAERARQHLKEIYAVSDVDFGDVFEDIAREAAGDARRFLNLLEVSALMAKKENGKLILTTEGLGDLVKKRRFDDDEYYDLLSAFIKSIRGSDPDAALIWGLKLHASGVPAETIFRRLLISASEDIGNAYPDALVFANAALSAYMNTGEPEGIIILAHAINFLASCPKSNRSYLAMEKAKKYLENNDPEIPENIVHNKKGYVYPHDFGGFVRQKYKPEGIRFYEPSENGYEQKISERLKRLWGERTDG
jgi:putative ATPase